MGIFDSFFDAPEAPAEKAEAPPPSERGQAVAEVLSTLLKEDVDAPLTSDASRESAAPLSRELVPLLMNRGLTESIGYLDDSAVSMARAAMEDGVYAGDRAGLFTWLHAQERAAVDAGFPRTVDGLLAYREASRKARDPRA